MADASTSNLRKQVYLLTAQDFLEHPIWEFCPDEEGIEGQDEATVRPSLATQVLNDTDGLYVVAADATFHDATTHPAYLYSAPPDDVIGLQPNILTPTAQVSLWFGSLRFRADPEGFLGYSYGLLGRDHSEIFPIRFQSRVPVNGAPLAITVSGFKALDHHDHIITLG